MYTILKKAIEYNHIKGNIYYILNINEYNKYDKDINTFTNDIEVIFNGMHIFRFASKNALDNVLTELIANGKFDLEIARKYST